MIHYEQRGPVGLITIDRPQARNAIDPAHAEAIAMAVDRIEADDSVRVGVLTGVAGSFCAGGDLKFVGERRQKTLATQAGGFCGLVRRARDKPMIAAVDGAAVGGGFELVLACDLVVATRNARFALPEVRRGIVAASGGLTRAAKLLPRNLAMELALTGRMIDAERAYRAGLINLLVAPEALLEASLDLAREIAANAPMAVRESRKLLLQSMTLEDAEGLRLGAASLELVMASEDAAEGARAFLEKRDPHWTSR